MIRSTGKYEKIVKPAHLNTFVLFIRRLATVIIYNRWIPDHLGPFLFKKTFGILRTNIDYVKLK